MAAKDIFSFRLGNLKDIWQMKQGNLETWVYVGKQDIQTKQSMINSHFETPFVCWLFFHFNRCGIFQHSISQNENSGSAEKCIPSIPFLKECFAHWRGKCYQGWI